MLHHPLAYLRYLFLCLHLLLGLGSSSSISSTRSSDPNPIVPLTQNLTFDLNGSPYLFSLTKGELLTEALDRACAEMNTCDPYYQNIVRMMILRNPEVTGSSADLFLINRCGRYKSDQTDTDFVETNMASFLSPLFPSHTAQDVYLPPIDDDDWVIDVISACGSWEPGLTFLLALSLSPLSTSTEKPMRSDLFMDIGSHLGYYSLVASKICGVSQVLAFECHPETAYQNMRGLVYNNASNVVLSTAAISESPNGNVFIPFQANENRGGMSVTYQGVTSSSHVNSKDEQRDNDISRSFSVPVTSIDNLNLSHVRLIKADVNGHDVELLKGARKLIENRLVDFLILEVGDLTFPRIKMLKMLMDNGYIVSCLDGGLLGTEAGNFVEETGTKHNRAREMLNRFQQELKNLITGNKCGSSPGSGRMNVESGMVTICKVKLERCYNTFIARSEEALEGVVKLALTL